MSRNTVTKAVAEVEVGIEPSDRQRPVGGGDKPAIEKQPGLLETLDELVHPETRGTPMSLLRWTLKSTYELARELQRREYRASADLVRRLLHQMGYSLQAPAKQNEGTSHPDRDGQFRYLNEQVKTHQATGQPLVSVTPRRRKSSETSRTPDASGGRRVSRLR